MSRFTRSVSLGLATILAISATAPAATASSRQESSAKPVTGPLILDSGGLGVAEWEEVQQNALASGDDAAATAAAHQIAILKGEVRESTILPTLAKQAIKAALKYGRHLLPKKIRPYADKIYNLVETWEYGTYTAVYTSCIAAGLPHDVADATARWVKTFL